MRRVSDRRWSLHRRRIFLGLAIVSMLGGVCREARAQSGAEAPTQPATPRKDPALLHLGKLKTDMERALDGCREVVGPGRVRRVVASCRLARDASAKYRAAAERLLTARASLPAEDDAEIKTTLPAAAAAAVEAKRVEEVNDGKDCAVPLSDRWCLDVPAFVGLLRVTFTSPNRFDSLSGFGTGLKFRWHALMRDGKRREILGLAPFLYYEPKVANSTGEAGTFQRLSAGVMVTVVEHFAAGFGMTVAHDESGVHLKAADRLMLLVGLNVDASTIGRAGK